MSEPAMFGLIRDGQARFYGDRWASVFLHREILYGPDDFEAWVTQLEELDEWDECCGGAVADYDRKRLVWQGDFEALRIPRVAAVYHRLLQAAWPGFEVASAREGTRDLAKAVGAAEPGQEDEEYGGYRPQRVREAARLDYDGEEADDEEDEVEADEEAASFDKEEIRAWVTLVGTDGTTRHRHLEHLPTDLLNARYEPLRVLRDLPAAEVPPEEVVAEGMWIDEANRSIGIWGSGKLRDSLPEMQQAWQGWTVEWAERGYDQQCRVAGPAGVPMKEAEALAIILPTVLSTKRFDMSTMLGALGGGIKKTAVKATGCLLMVICLPLVIFGLVSGNWRAVLISIAVTCAVVIAAFKVIEYRFKRAFMGKLPRAGNGNAPPAAGPMEESARRKRIDQLLVSAGLPRLAEVEPLFPEKSELDLLT